MDCDNMNHEVFYPDERMNKRRIITLSTLLLSLYVSLAFLFHFFLYSFSGTFYCVSIAAIILIFVLSKPVMLGIVPRNYTLLWMISIIILVYNYIYRNQNNAVLVDVVVFSSGLFVILFCSQNSRDYSGAIKAIRLFSIIFALGVLIERYFPSLFRMIISILPSKLENVLSSGIGKASVKGFTTNVGFSAAYISIGILSYIAFKDTINKRNSWTIHILLLGYTLLLTGKRGVFLFLVLSIILVSFIPIKGMEKARKYWKLFLALLGIIVSFFLLKDFLIQIPLFGRIILSIDRFFSGEDITSGRSSLFNWAIRVFLNNPIFGIGWGNYKKTVVGVATLVSSLDVHNVYLQLLCETGIIGFICFVSVFIFSWITTKNLYCSCLNNTDELSYKWRPLLLFSFGFQTFFLLYCLTGNPLYDQIYQIIYILSCSISIGYKASNQLY